MKISVKVPATTANLGPGFDALGLALDLWNETEFLPTNDKQMALTISGEGLGKLPTDASNCIIEAALQVYGQAHKPCNGLRIHCINRVPIGSGLGSSSAAMLTGMLGANALLGNPFSQEEILKMAIETEGHPDNVAPAMLGGLVASIVYEERVVSLKLPARANLGQIHLTVVWPDFDFPTKQARAILPKQVERKDAIYNISRAVLVTEALRTGDLDLLGIAMTDMLHQPYRIPLIPGAQLALEAARQAGAAAVALSGAGPSLIAFSSKVNKIIGKVMSHEFEKAGLSSKIYHLQVSHEGAEVSIL
ncbi:MAG: homoserine kinase [Chloroflexi bacterium GWB2_49_20]|nr:MAG: homoserine kinase [Chloroflexi bacterium GWB2_49_20]OGN76083.1 MAG: homoserine kinase [Chloroflexi bacterium GWC2_49_37]OGN83469.1 MAG: homoserine kinase [Chloroflexi bacterium GWD2_49_16]HBG73868.1 homoserine kinase [Anaerolineae bacterium]HCC79553.1 homoserine kinase [Anaerolineae bacterium]